MENIDRRRLLLGLAAASTAAATVTVDSAVATQLENPKLLALAEQLPNVAKAYHEAERLSRAVEREWNAKCPWAPDEITVKGTAWPSDDWNQPGEPERKPLGGWLWRQGDDYPRRIVVTEREANYRLHDAKANLRLAMKKGKSRRKSEAEWRAEIEHWVRLKSVAEKYERKFREVELKGKREHEKFWRPANAARDAFEYHVAAMMNEPDLTMEGLVIKAQALAEWDKIGGPDKIAFRHGKDWHGQIAASILRHAGVGEGRI